MANTKRVTRRGAAAVAAAVIGLVSGCAPPAPSGPTPEDLPRPTPEEVVRITTDRASTSRRPMSGDGGVVAYSQIIPGTGVVDAFLWDASTNSTVPLTSGATDGAPSGSATDPPFVSHDGSTVVFTSSVPVIGGQANTGNSVFRYAVATGETEQIEIPEAYGEGPIDGVSTSGDGSLIVVSYGDKVLTWTAASGFSELTDPTRLEEAGTSYSFSAVGAPVSNNGRYVTVIALVPITLRWGPGQVLSGPGICWRPEVNDLVSGDVALGSCIQKTDFYVPWPNPRYSRTPILATTDEGGVLFGPATDSGVAYWDPVTGLKRVLGTNNFVWTGSPDGNAVGYSNITTSGGGYIMPGSEGSGRLLIREPLGRAVLGNRTSPVGIGDGAEKVLLYSNNADSVGAGPDDTRSLYLWTRTG